jgi:polyhydroxyalkanoate synthase
MELLGRVLRDVERNALRARNGIKMAVANDRPTVGQTPKDAVWRRDRVTLYRYRNDRLSLSPPIFIVFSLVSRSYILDLQPGNSFIEHLLNEGLDVFLLDWGIPDERDAANTLEDYTDSYMPAGIKAALASSGADQVHLLGYCFGGVLALLSVAHNAQLPVRSLTTMATPVDCRVLGAFSSLLRDGRIDIADLLDNSGNIPPDIIHQSFKMLKPTAEAAQYATLLERLWDDDYVGTYQAMTQWSGEHIPFPGTAARQVIDLLIIRNALITGEMRLGGEPVRLSDVTCAYLDVVAERDYIVPAASCRAYDYVGSADKEQLRVDAGHMGLAVGQAAARVTIPRIIDFIVRRSSRVPTASTVEGS